MKYFGMTEGKVMDWYCQLSASVMEPSHLLHHCSEQQQETRYYCPRTSYSINGSTATRRTLLHTTMVHGSLDERALWDSIKLQGSCFLSRHARFDNWVTGVVTDVDGDMRLLRGTSRTVRLSCEYEATKDESAQRVGMLTLMRIKQSVGREYLRLLPCSA